MMLTERENIKMEKNYMAEKNVDSAVVPLKRESLYVANPILLPKIKKSTYENGDNTIKTEATSNKQSALVSEKVSSCPKRRESGEMKKRIFGYELIMDLSECDLKVMSSKNKLTEYVDTLCKLIDMKKYGKVQLPYFGLEKPQTKGYSLLQFIETSSITGHFSEYWRKSYINVFSCKPYDHKLAAKFTKEFFGAKHAKSRLIVR